MIKLKETLDSFVENRQLELRLRKLQQAYEELFKVIDFMTAPNTWTYEENPILNIAARRLARSGLINQGKKKISNNDSFNLLGIHIIINFLIFSLFFASSKLHLSQHNL